MGCQLSPGDLLVLEMPLNVVNPNPLSTNSGSQYLHRLLLRSPPNCGLFLSKSKTRKRHTGSRELPLAI
jgi:hypothetical protein